MADPGATTQLQAAGSVMFCMLIRASVRCLASRALLCLARAQAAGHRRVEPHEVPVPGVGVALNFTAEQVESHP